MFCLQPPSFKKDRQLFTALQCGGLFALKFELLMLNLAQTLDQSRSATAFAKPVLSVEANYF
jgi:hypothetical protein